MPRARVMAAGAVLAALTAIGAVGFVLLEGLSWPDAIYLAIVTPISLLENCIQT